MTCGHIYKSRSVNSYKIIKVKKYEMDKNDKMSKFNQIFSKKGNSSFKSTVYIYIS